MPSAPLPAGGDGTPQAARREARPDSGAEEGQANTHRDLLGPEPAPVPPAVQAPAQSPSPVGRGAARHVITLRSSDHDVAGFRVVLTGPIVTCSSFGHTATAHPPAPQGPPFTHAFSKPGTGSQPPRLLPQDEVGRAAANPPTTWAERHGLAGQNSCSDTARMGPAHGPRTRLPLRSGEADQVLPDQLVPALCRGVGAPPWMFRLSAWLSGTPVRATPARALRGQASLVGNGLAENAWAPGISALEEEAGSRTQVPPLRGDATGWSRDLPRHAAGSGRPGQRSRSAAVFSYSHTRRPERTDPGRNQQKLVGPHPVGSAAGLAGGGSAVALIWKSARRGLGRGAREQPGRGGGGEKWRE